MLVLSRQRDETIMIGDEIEITVVDIRGDKVRLGITAPTRIAVHRKEVYEAIRAENEQAARLTGGQLPRVGSDVSPGPMRTKIGRASRLSAGSTPLSGDSNAPARPGSSPGVPQIQTNPVNPSIVKPA
jgi:carbon storage regulator